MPDAEIYEPGAEQDTFARAARAGRQQSINPQQSTALRPTSFRSVPAIEAPYGLRNSNPALEDKAEYQRRNRRAGTHGLITAAMYRALEQHFGSQTAGLISGWASGFLLSKFGKNL